MCEVPVFYATTDGQTRRIAERIAQELRRRGLVSAAIDLDSTAASNVDWNLVRAVGFGASLRAGRHQAVASTFARQHREALGSRPSLFFSVSLSAGSKRAEERAAAERLAQTFVTTAGWKPLMVACVAGCLAYTRYGWFTRLLMRRIARKEGGPTDTTRDHELTDWTAVSEMARHFADLIQATPERGRVA